MKDSYFYFFSYKIYIPLCEFYTKGLHVIQIRKHVLFFAILISVLAGGTYSCQTDKTEKADRSASAETGLEPNIADMVTSMNLYAFNEIVKAPDFELMSVKGERVSLSQHRGQVILLSFWATW
jgi:cytochrome oxidase Cu insertion factor (SCO1/SenC/PrrC family)